MHALMFLGKRIQKVGRRVHIHAQKDAEDLEWTRKYTHCTYKDNKNTAFYATVIKLSIWKMNVVLISSFVCCEFKS